jgi:hypothetical protein
MYQSIVKLLSEKDIRIFRITTQYLHGILYIIGLLGKHRVWNGTQSVYPNGERGENDQTSRAQVRFSGESVRADSWIH